MTPKQAKISSFITEQVRGNGFQKVVVGLSGGIDSALVAFLCVHALGKENVLGLMLPYRSSQQASLDDALAVAEALQIEHQTVPITPMVDGYFAQQTPDKLQKGNFCARMRMSVLFDYAQRENALVAGTGNRSELLIGYCTVYGDGACSFEPIGHLYKTEVWQMAKELGVPEQIITKPPTADLWDGQTDEQELGLSYAMLDKMLIDYQDNKLSPEKLSQKYDAKLVEKVVRLVQNSKFKRVMPPILER